jgi:hypothetical protein
MLILYRYIWLVYVYFGLSADFDYPRPFSPPLPRIIESLLYLKIVPTLLSLLLLLQHALCFLSLLCLHGLSGNGFQRRRSLSFHSNVLNDWRLSRNYMGLARKTQQRWRLGLPRAQQPRLSSKSPRLGLSASELRISRLSAR